MDLMYVHQAGVHMSHKNADWAGEQFNTLEGLYGIAEGSYDDLEDYYFTFVDTMVFKESTKAVLEELTTSIATFKVGCLLPPLFSTFPLLTPTIV